MKTFSLRKLLPLLALAAVLFCVPAQAAAAHSHKDCGKPSCSHTEHSGTNTLLNGKATLSL